MKQIGESEMKGNKPHVLCEYGHAWETDRED